MKKQMLLLLAVLAAAACTVKEPTVEPVLQTPEPEAVEPGSATILFGDDLLALIEEDLSGGSLQTKSSDLNAALQALGIVRMERVFPDAGEYEARSRREGLHRFYDVEFDPSFPVTRAVETLISIPGVESVEPHRKVALRSFNDPDLSRQWNLVNTSSEGADVNVQAVWDEYTVGSSDVVVSIVDEGVCYTHPDLAANMWDDGSGNPGYNFVKNNSTVTWKDAADIGHGTHVAGVVSAVNNNGVGVCGIAGGDFDSGVGGVRLMSCQIFAGYEGCSDSGCGRAIKWGADHGALISQNSWGFYADTNDDGKVSSSELEAFKASSIPSAIKAAIDYFIKYAGCDSDGNQKEDSPMKGGLVFFAAGNENIDYDPICDYDPVIAVGAFGGSGTKASYSNYGDWVDLGAPGGDGRKYILSTLPTQIASSGYGGTDWMGTSMACPHASGVAALLVSYYGGEGFTADRCRELLLEGAVDGYFASDKPIGRKLDALGSFLLGGKISDGGAPVLSWTSARPGELHAHETTEVTFTVTDPAGGTPTVELEEPVSGVTLSGSGRDWRLRICGPESKTGNQTVRIVATGKRGTGRFTLNYVVLENHAPKVTGAFGPVLLYPGESWTADIQDIFTDEDGETPDYQFTEVTTDAAFIALSKTVLKVAALRKGDFTLTVTATDALGLSATASAPVVIKDPDSPVDIYPQPAVDELYVRNDSLTEGMLDLTVYSSTGTRLLDESLRGNVFNPVKLDVSSLAPGRYLLIVKYGYKTYKLAMVKG